MRPTRHRGIFRPTRVEITDTRSPMLRLLQDGALPANERGVMIAVNYHEQWPTLIKAMRLGYVNDDQYLTDAGRAFIAKAIK